MIRSKSSGFEWRDTFSDTATQIPKAFAVWINDAIPYVNARRRRRRKEYRIRKRKKQVWFIFFLFTIDDKMKHKAAISNFNVKLDPWAKLISLFIGWFVTIVCARANIQVPFHLNRTNCKTCSKDLFWCLILNWQCVFL